VLLGCVSKSFLEVRVRKIGKKVVFALKGKKIKELLLKNEEGGCAALY